MPILQAAALVRLFKQQKWLVRLRTPRGSTYRQDRSAIHAHYAVSSNWAARYDGTALAMTCAIVPGGHYQVEPDPERATLE